jgi:hypothetical protein
LTRPNRSAISLRQNHSCSIDRIAFESPPARVGLQGYRIGEDQSGGNRTILQTAGRCETSEIELSAEPSAAPVRDRDAPGGVRGEPVGSQSRSHSCVGSITRERGRSLRLPRQDFAPNLSAKRRLCNTVGGSIVEGCAACCCALSAARSRATTTTNLARSSLALVLRAIFGGAKSCALVNLFMICPRWSAGG